MVDWDRVEELRSKGWDWAKIAGDPKVAFRPDAAIRDPGRALRALYHRQRARERRQGPEPSAPKRSPLESERKWTLTRIGYLAVPLLGVWFTLAYVAPSPVGLLVPAIPYLALGLVVAAFVLIFALWRKVDGKRWSPMLRTTVIGGVVLGLVVAGITGLAGALIFGCPYLPPGSSLSSTSAPGWEKGNIASWQDGGRPVYFFYGATWCPFCSASSWAIWKALTEFGGSVAAGSFSDYSSGTDSFPNTPEVVLAGAQSSTIVAMQVSEDTSGVQNTQPATASCYQQAYVTAYSNGIPFLVINGQYIHTGTLVNPQSLSTWASGANGGDTSVQTSVQNEVAVTGGNPWLVVQAPAWWIMAMLAKTTGQSVSTLSSTYSWSASTTQNVTADLRLL